MNPKQRAAEAALQFVRDGMVVGLGTGSTADFFLVALADAIRDGRVKNVRGIPTSVQSEKRATELNIPLISLSEAQPDVTIDGADEIGPNLDLIKGLGGALLREKIVAQNSRKLVIIADAGKKVARLGTLSALPVEVAQFGHDASAAFLRSLGCSPRLRTKTDGSIFQTDNGNVIYDCRFESIDDPHTLERSLSLRAGVVESGLFLNLCDVALIANENSVEELHR